MEKVCKITSLVLLMAFSALLLHQSLPHVHAHQHENATLAQHAPHHSDAGQANHHHHTPDKNQEEDKETILALIFKLHLNSFHVHFAQDYLQSTPTLVQDLTIASATLKNEPKILHLELKRGIPPLFFEGSSRIFSHSPLIPRGPPQG